jgi:membrane peptidoglycan carboxypeptidase
MRRRRNIRWKRLLLLGSAGSLLGVALLVGVGYAVTDVPEPNESATATATRILYSDRSEMGRVGEQNRIPVDLDDVPEDVQRAVLSAEDRGTTRTPASTPRASPRAVRQRARRRRRAGRLEHHAAVRQERLPHPGPHLQPQGEGGLHRAEDEPDRREGQVLEDYLNTIYFGRQASGIEVAAQTYFNRPADKLSLAQGAVLAASIKSPASLDPEKHPEEAKRRWAYVLDGMVEQGWLTEAERARSVYPTVAEDRPGQPQQRPVRAEGLRHPGRAGGAGRPRLPRGQALRRRPRRHHDDPQGRAGGGDRRGAGGDRGSAR